MTGKLPYDGQAARGGVNHDITCIRCRRDQCALQSDGPCVRVPVPARSLGPDIGNGADSPHAPCPARLLLRHDQILATAPCPVAHANPALVPSQQVRNRQASAGQPCGESSAKMELVHPQEQAATGHEGSVHSPHEFADECLWRLRDLTPSHAFAFFPYPSLSIRRGTAGRRTRPERCRPATCPATPARRFACGSWAASRKECRSWEIAAGGLGENTLAGAASAAASSYDGRADLPRQSFARHALAGQSASGANGRAG